MAIKVELKTQNPVNWTLTQLVIWGQNWLVKVKDRAT